MSKREYRLPIHDVIMGVGLGARADRGGWNNPKETTPEEQKAADEAAIKSLYGKYKRRASDESLSSDDRDKWSKAALDLEFRNPDLFND